MSTQVIRRLTPEEEELERRRAELQDLEAEMLQRELELETLRADLQTFENVYLRRLGPKYAELDDLEAQIAETRAKGAPAAEDIKEEARRARAKATETERTRKEVEAAESPKGDTQREALRKLYVEVAKKLHPDLTTDETERARRQKAMAEVNAAYEAGDEAKLRDILAKWESSPEAVQGEGIGASLIRVIRQIAQAKKRLAEIAAEAQRLRESEIGRLREKVQGAAVEGRDLFAEMAVTLDTQIRDARQRLQALRARTQSHAF